MAAPTLLGLVAAGDVYAADTGTYTGGGITSPLELTTLVDVPRSRAPHFAPLVILLRLAPAEFFGSPNGLAIDPAAIFDDAPDPADGVPPNSYGLVGPGGDGSLAYDFGRPTTESLPSFDIGTIESPAGGSVCGALFGFLSRPLPAGSTITIPFAADPKPSSLLSATALAFLDAGTPEAELAARTIYPADTSDGNSANVPLGDHQLSDLATGIEYLIAHVWCDDSGVDAGAPVAPTIAGTETVDDTGTGVWTKIDSGGRPSTSYFGGLVYSVFVADSAAVDLSQPIVSFAVSDGIGNDSDQPRPGASSGGPFTGISILRMQFQPPNRIPAASRVFPA